MTLLLSYRQKVQIVIDDNYEVQVTKALIVLGNVYTQSHTMLHTH